MLLTDLDSIVRPWVTDGVLSNQDRLRLRLAYLESLGTPDRCTTCPDFYNDARHWAMITLKQNGFPPMSTSRKYRLKEGVGYISVLTSNVIIIDQGEPREGVQLLTNEVAEELLKRTDGYAEFIETNPDYVAPEAKTGKSKKATPSVEAAPADDDEAELARLVAEEEANKA